MLQKKEDSCVSGGKRLINIKELSEFIGVSVNTLYAWVNQHKIPFIKCNGIIRFDMKDIEAWIEENKVAAQKF